MISGESYYRAAIKLTDLHGKRFCDMMARDFRESEVEREFFTGDFRGLELYGWAEFCELMMDSKQEKWLRKINALDESVMMNLLESRLMDAMEGKLTEKNGRVIDKDALDATVKALQGLVGRAKILNEQGGDEVEKSTVEITFSGVDVNPITGEVYNGTEKTNDIKDIADDIKNNSGEK